ncbi:MAG: 4Fe-4S binding protein [Nitrospinaceae bacterium]|nr:4Fe-4S binding protein [Nitrospinaceae bacterium]
MADLQVEFCGIEFKNPIVVASAEPGNSLENIKTCIDHGAGGVIIKTVGDIPAMQTLTDNSKYAILNDRGKFIKGKITRSFFFYSRSGYAKEYYEEWVPILKEAQAYARQHGSHIIGNIASDTVAGWIMLAKVMKECGIELVELNYQCPHPSDYNAPTVGNWIAQDPTVTAELTRQILAAVDIKVMVKLTPEAHNLTAVAKAAYDAGAGSVAVNSRFVGFAVNIDEAEPYIGGPAGIGGPWIKYLTLRWIYDIYSNHGIPMSGSNGIYDGRDAIEYFMTGAKIMQVCSVLMLRGIEWLPKIISQVDQFLDEHGYADLESIYGIAAKKSKPLQQLFEEEPVYALIDHDKCKFPKCAICVKMCFYDSLKVGKDKINTYPETCIGCDLCQNVCPFDALRMTPDKELALRMS